MLRKGCAGVPERSALEQCSFDLFTATARWSSRRITSSGALHTQTQVGAGQAIRAYKPTSQARPQTLAWAFLMGL